MDNKQQTALEWFLDQLIEHRIIIVDKTTYQVKYKHEILLEQAKEMEKERIIKGYANGHNDGCRYMNNEKQQFEHGEQYYEQTYGGGEQ